MDEGLSSTTLACCFHVTRKPLPGAGERKTTDADADTIRISKTNAAGGIANKSEDEPEPQSNANGVFIAWTARQCKNKRLRDVESFATLENLVDVKGFQPPQMWRLSTNEDNGIQRNE